MKRLFASPLSLRHRFLFAFAALIATSALIGILLAMFVADRALAAARETVRDLALSATRLDFSEASASHVWARQLAEHPALTSLRIRDRDGRVVFTHTRAHEAAPWTARLFTRGAERRLTLPFGPSAATLEAEISTRPVHDAVRHALFAVAVLTGALLAVLAVVARGLLTSVAAPLKPLAIWVREFARGQNWRQPAPEIESDCREVRELHQAVVEGCAAMRHQLHSLEETRDLLDHSEGRLQTLVDGMQEALFELDPHGRVRFLNPAWERLTGFPPAESQGRLFADFLMDEDWKRRFDPSALGELSARDCQVALRHASGRQLYAGLHAETQRGAGGRINGVIGTLGDITARVELDRLLARYQDELYQLSVTDPLTGLYNRRHFDNQLEVILAEHLPRNQSVCLLLIDLDGFKFINDTYGHPFGDEVLRMTAQLLRSLIRRHDYVARMAGDEFAMVLKNADLAAATAIANKLHARINATRVELPVGHMQLQASIGVAEAPKHGDNAGDLVSAADVALYHSRRRGRNRVEALSPDMSKAVMSLFHQGFRLRRALDEGHLHPVFQPIYDLHCDEPVAMEVLARMQLDDDVVQAKDFIAVAEELGLTRDLDLHIIRRALEIAPAELALFLNVDITSFNDRDFAEELRRLIGPACRSGRRITIEITERETIPMSDTLMDDIHSLRTLGCKLALDDFGSGYSTYNFLNQFRPDYLKIEGSFVRDMLESEAARKIVMHIHELAQSFGMETIAESVETEAVRDELRRIGIRNVQGWLYGQPARTA
jgi:diguanylate cyclase (GGDEF)-like protein/PAS domain S-box-containing protein